MSSHSLALCVSVCAEARLLIEVANTCVYFNLVIGRNLVFTIHEPHDKCADITYFNEFTKHVPKYCKVYMPIPTKQAPNRFSIALQLHLCHWTFGTWKKMERKNKKLTWIQIKVKTKREKSISIEHALNQWQKSDQNKNMLKRNLTVQRTAEKVRKKERKKKQLQRVLACLV